VIESNYHVALNQPISFNERETYAFIRASQSILKAGSFNETARIIFDQARDIIGATAGYVALLSSDGNENEVLFLEAGGLPCTVDPSLPMPIRGLRAEAYSMNMTVYHNEFKQSAYARFMPSGHVALRNVMFAPLLIDKKTVGVIGLANKSSDFTQRDANVATVFGELASIALYNSRTIDKLTSTLRQLESTLAEVKQLRGILPICASCKKIRDDKGYWNQIELYIRDHSDAEFSHGICPECAQRLYPAEFKKMNKS